MNTTSVLTLNLWGTNGPYDERMTQLKKFLHEVRPSILTFQEVACVHGAPQVQSIIDMLDYKYVYLETGVAPSASDGLTVCTLGEIVDYRTVALPVRQGGYPRFGQVVTIVLGGTHLVVVNTHLSYDPNDQDIRCTQVETLLAAVGSVGVPLVFCGDLNEVPTGLAVSEIESSREAGLVDAWTAGCADPLTGGTTFNPENIYLDDSIRDARRYDYVFVSPDITVKQCGVVLSDDDEFGPLSDHYGVLADLFIPASLSETDY